MGDDNANHDDGCRCAACCRAKFKTIDPARVGKAPATTLPEVLAALDAPARLALAGILGDVDRAREAGRLKP